jgi:hypothetical protein
MDRVEFSCVFNQAVGCQYRSLGQVGGLQIQRTLDPSSSPSASPIASKLLRPFPSADRSPTTSGFREQCSALWRTAYAGKFVLSRSLTPNLLTKVVRYGGRKRPGGRLIEEEFGDGIMWAIDFGRAMERLPDPKGDRVKVCMSSYRSITTARPATRRRMGVGGVRP